MQACSWEKVINIVHIEFELGDSFQTSDHNYGNCYSGGIWIDFLEFYLFMFKSKRMNHTCKGKPSTMMKRNAKTIEQNSILCILVNAITQR